MLTLSGQKELRGEVEELLTRHGLPTQLDDEVSAPGIATAVQRDKKRRGGKVGFVLLDKPGELRTGCSVEQREIDAALQTLYR
jgi:shikimate kinase/3-dehydroquinate synthase